MLKSQTPITYLSKIKQLCTDIWYGCSFSTFTWSVPFRVQWWYVLILFHSCWSASGSGFSRTRKGKWRARTKCPFFNSLIFFLILQRPRHTDKPHQLPKNCCFLEGNPSYKTTLTTQTGEQMFIIPPGIHQTFSFFSPRCTDHLLPLLVQE